MKTSLLALTALSFLFFMTVRCKKSSPIDCSAKTARITAAASVYGADQSSANCKSYKAALQDYFSSSCANSMTAEQKSDMKDAIDALTCP